MNKVIPPISNRLKVYFTERFPILVYAPFVVILYTCLSFITQIISHQIPVIDIYWIVGCISAFFMMLLVRTFDDLKDVQLDMDIFPERPVSRGAVLVNDVKALALISFSTTVLLNCFFAPRSLTVFVVVIVYVLGTFKYFFTKELHIKKPVIAMITHQPLPLSILFFLIHTSLASGPDYDSFETQHLFLLLAFALPITAWEISRKTKAADQEIPRYETFSRILGPRLSASLPLLLYSISATASILLAHHLMLSKWYDYLIVLYFLIMSFFYFRFIKNPLKENNVLINTAIVFTASYFTTLLVFIFMSYDISILW